MYNDLIVYTASRSVIDFCMKDFNDNISRMHTSTNSVGLNA